MQDGHRIRRCPFLEEMVLHVEAPTQWKEGKPKKKGKKKKKKRAVCVVESSQKKGNPAARSADAQLYLMT